MAQCLTLFPVSSSRGNLERIEPLSRLPTPGLEQCQSKKDVPPCEKVPARRVELEQQCVRLADLAHTLYSSATHFNNNHLPVSSPNVTRHSSTFVCSHCLMLLIIQQVGAGPSGLAASLSLVKSGVSVRIIEKDSAHHVGQRGAGVMA